MVGGITCRLLFLTGRIAEFRVQVGAVVVRMVAVGIQQAEKGAAQAAPNVYPVDHHKPAARRQIADDVIDIRDVPALLIQRAEVIPHESGIGANAFKGPHGPERI